MVAGIDLVTRCSVFMTEALPLVQYPCVPLQRQPHSGQCIYRAFVESLHSLVTSQSFGIRRDALLQQAPRFPNTSLLEALQEPLQYLVTSYW